MAAIFGIVLGLAPVFAGDGPQGAVREFVYKKAPEGELKMHVHFPPGWRSGDKRPAIVFFFGGGWQQGSVGQFTRQAEYLAGRGMVAARADYRVQSRHMTTPDKCVEDAKSAVRWLRQRAAELGVDPDRIVASGGSAGGHIAACAAVLDGFDPASEDTAASSKPNLLILFNPALDLTRLGRKIANAAGDDIARAMSPALYVKRTTPPTVIFFGTSDRLLDGGRAWMVRAREAGSHAELFTADGQAHGFFNRPPWTEATLRQADLFLAAHSYLTGDPTVQVPGEAKLEQEAAPAGDDFRPLFDGRSLAGWTQHGGKAKYHVEHGEVIGTSVLNTANSFLCTDRHYRDFILELEFKVDAGLNSGVQVRSNVFDNETTFDVKSDGKVETRKIPAGRVHGYQVEIDPSQRAWTGGIYDEGRRGWLNSLANNEPARQAFRANEWNRLRVECRGSSIRTWLNGVPAADLTDDLTPSGFIALQVHGIGNKTELATKQVRWRSIRIKELPAGT